MMLNNMPEFSGDEDDEDDEDEEDGIDLDFIFRNSSPSKKRKGRKKAGFQELL